jgi:hypothetical protein
MTQDPRSSNRGMGFHSLVAGTIRPIRAVIAGVALAAVGVLGAGRASALATPTSSVTGFGDASAHGAPSASQVNAPVAGMAPTPGGRGYWLVGADGGVFTYGDAGFYGSAAGEGALTPFVGLAATPDGHGYWVAGDFGNIYNFGDAPSEAVLAGEYDAPVVGIVANPKGVGYWLVGADGGVFAYGDASFYGSMGGKALNAPVVGMASTPDGRGYWLVAADGGIFSFGDASFYGSMGGKALNSPMVGMASTPDGRGYWLVAADGGIFSFGNASFYGSMGAEPPSNDGEETPCAHPGALRAGPVRLRRTSPAGGGAHEHCARVWGRQRQPHPPHLVVVDRDRCNRHRRLPPQQLHPRLRGRHVRLQSGQRPAWLPRRDERRARVRVGQLHLRRPFRSGRFVHVHQRGANQSGLTRTASKTSPSLRSPRCW